MFINKSFSLSSSKEYLSRSFANASSIKDGDAIEMFEKSIVFLSLIF